MQLQYIYKSDIDRPINGVIKVAQNDEQSIEQELREYIITRELRKHFNTFFSAYYFNRLITNTLVLNLLSLVFSFPIPILLAIVINNIKNVEIVDNENEIVDVYTIDGVLIKRNVKAAEATKNLAKGIYIVGKKKVLVK